jgi:uncharacterized protein (DUF2384 family)
MTAPAGFEDGLHEFLDEVTKAGQVMAVAPDVPEPVEALVRRFEGLLYADAPERGLADIDPYLGESLLGGAVVCLKGLLDEDLDQRRRRVRIGLERIRQALRDIVDESPAGDSRSSKDVVRWLADTMSVPQTRLAGLLGVTPRTMQRWLSETDEARPVGDAEARLRAIAHVTSHLRHVFTGPGVVRWFERPHPSLDDEPPETLLRDPVAYPLLNRLASRARSITAT